MKKNLRTIILTVLISATAIILATALASCNKKNDGATGTSEDISYSPEYGGTYDSDDVKTEDNVEQETEDVLAEDRKIIKTVNQTLQTEDFDGVIDNIYAVVTELGGYVSDSSFTGESYYNKNRMRRASITVRIPAQGLSDFVGRAEKDAVVTSYKESARDVTGAYIDVESRISVFEAEETALLKMSESSPDTATMLQIRKSLNEVQSELASLRAQKKSYDSRINYSTVYIDVEEVRQATSNDPSFFEEIGDNFSDSLYGLGNFFRDFAVWFIGDILYILLWAAVIAGIVIALVKIYKRRKRKEDDCDENG